MHRKWLKVFLTVLATVVGLYALILLIAYLIQDHMVFPAGKTLWRTPADFGWAYEDVLLRVGSEQTHGWYIPREGARATVLFSHGNGGTIAARLEVAEMFREQMCNVLLYDYGGYGNSTGKPSEQRCYADVQAMYDWLIHTKGIPPNQIIAFGESLGGAVAIDLASQKYCGGVILLATFVSAVQIGQESFPFLPVRTFLRHRFMSGSKIAAIHAPLLIFHSPDDEIVPFHHGEELFRLANEPKQFVTIRGGHNDGFFVSQQEITAAVAAFLDAHFPVP